MPRLEDTQRWVQAVITHPDGVAAGAGSTGARGLVGGGGADSVVTRSRALSAEERLAVYHNAYYARLLTCLREEFPVLEKTLGEDAFDAFAFGYLQEYPSCSYTLGRLAADFARYLAETYAEEGGEAAPGWGEFLIDLARLEWAYGEVFDGPGVEGQPPFDAGGLARVPAERWPDLVLTAAPCLRLLELRFPAHRYHAAARGRSEPPPPPEPAPTLLAVTRRDFIVRNVELSPLEHAALLELVGGRTLGDALAALPAADKCAAGVDVAGWFRRWASEGFFTGAALAGGRVGGDR